MNLDYKLNNKLALVTAGSKGIGFATAYQLLNNSAKVAICSRSKKNLNKVKKIFKKKFSSKNFLVIKFDLTNNKNLPNLVKKIEKYFGKNIDILVNNCGGPPAKQILKTNDLDWQNALNRNLLSSIILSKLVVKKMIKKKWGRIINLTSTTAKEAAQNMCLSNVTRAGIVAFSKTFSLEFGSYGITSNSILTGACETDRFKKLINPENRKNYKNILKKISRNIPAGYVSKPEEFGHIISFLCSDYSNYINGAAIPIDGGILKSNF